VISDTHGLLPQRVPDACAGADHIIHAGDVGAQHNVQGTGAPSSERLEELLTSAEARADR
jgi:hypothetical protein